LATRVGCRVQQIVSIHESRDAFHARNFAFIIRDRDKKKEEEKGRRQGDHCVKSRYAS